MNALREAAQQALKALSLALSDVEWRVDSPTQRSINNAYNSLRDALAQQAEPVAWTDAEADAARLAMELECLLTDKDVPTSTVSRWWESAHEALDLHRRRLAATLRAAQKAEPKTNWCGETCERAKLCAVCARELAGGQAAPVDQTVMELAESVGLIGPASRAHDLHGAIQRFHDLIVMNASIKAAEGT